MDETGPTRRPRRLGTGGWAGIWVVAILFAFTVPGLPAMWRFRPSAMVGLSADEVIARCGDPEFASATLGPEEREDDPGAPARPLWKTMNAPERGWVRGHSRYFLGYVTSWPPPWGTYHKVVFIDGKVESVESYGK